MARSNSSAQSPQPRVQWRRAIWPAILAVTIFSASNQSQLAGPPGIPFLDKIAHTSVFGLLATLVIRVHFDEARPLRSVLFAILIVSGYGITDEIHQSFTPGRSVEFADWVADTIGATLATTAYGFWPMWRNLLEAGRSLARSGAQTARREKVASVVMAAERKQQ